eukprot:624160-Pelagomonas_calceolata.AAC.5
MSWHLLFRSRLCLLGVPSTFSTNSQQHRQGKHTTPRLAVEKLELMSWKVPDIRLPRIATH